MIFRNHALRRLERSAEFACCHVHGWRVAVPFYRGQSVTCALWIRLSSLCVCLGSALMPRCTKGRLSLAAHASRCAMHRCRETWHCIFCLPHFPFGSWLGATRPFWRASNVASLYRDHQRRICDGKRTRFGRTGGWKPDVNCEAAHFDARQGRRSTPGS